MERDILEYAAFTTDPAGGNPAGVVLDASGLTDAEMLSVAAAVGYSETVFVMGRADAAADPDRAFRVRYFSPQIEVPFCGHATVALAVALAERIGAGKMIFETAAGAVPVAVSEHREGMRATLTSVQPYVELIDDEDVIMFLDTLGWYTGELDPALPPRIAYAGARHLVLAAATRERLATLSYDFDGLAELMREHDLITVQLVWRESADTFVVRNPFPVGGVVEDPATGAAALAFGAYLRDLEAVPADARLLLRQGEDLGRPSRLEVELRGGEDHVRVSGTAVKIDPQT